MKENLKMKRKGRERIRQFWRGGASVFQLLPYVVGQLGVS